jgi:quercetin 2,3-dioxygenase
MITIRRSEERGHADHGWLDSRHTFSFAEYHDPVHMGFRALRVINEDRVAPETGFPSHPHRDMEILTYVLSGRLRHRDSMGNGSLILPGDVQRMTAGTGVVHSEFNDSASEPLHLLQIWILPERRGLAPGYEQKAFAEDERRGRLRLVASHGGHDGSLTVHQDASLYASILARGESVRHELARGRHAWLQVASGEIRLGERALRAGDAAAASDEPALEIRAESDRAEILLFDLA